jgi:hypothetical protein
MTDTTNPETFMQNSTESAWNKRQLANAARARKWEIEHHLSLDKLKTMTDEEYLASRYYNPKDKKGVHHLRNMISSIMQGDKSFTGRSFEDSFLELAKQSGISLKTQVNIDDGGNIKPKRAAHKVDGVVHQIGNPLTNLLDTYVLSNKTTARERWTQDKWCVPLCKKLIYITREKLTKTTIENMVRAGLIVVFPHAPITESTWSYAEFIRQMKLFQNGTAYRPR